MKNINFILASILVFTCSTTLAGKKEAGQAIANQMAAETATQNGADNKSTAGQQTSVFDSSKDANSKSNSGSAISSLIQVGTKTAGSAMIPSCFSPIPPTSCFVGVGLIAASVLFGKQAKSFKGSANVAGTTMGQTYGYGDLDAGGGAVKDLSGNELSSPLDDPYVRSIVDANAYKAVVDKIAKSGIDFNNPNGKVTIGGKDYKVSDFQSADAMKKAGMPDSVSSAFQSKLDSITAMAQQKAEKALNSKLGSHTAANGYEEGGGAGRSSSSSSASDSSSAGNSSAGLGSGLAGKGLGRDPAAVSGLSKDLNGDPIGVASDSIFAMMTRRYKLKEKQNSFIDAALKPQL